MKSRLKVLFCTAALIVAGCRGIKGPAASEGQSARSFSTAQQAAEEFNRALQADDQKALAQIFGAEGEALLNSGDPVEDKNARTAFAERMAEKFKVEEKSDGDFEILVGHKDWPFPIPISQNEKGWSFDTAAGKEELLNRRVGRNEIKTIRSVRTVVEAENEYYKRSRSSTGARVYAAKIGSTPGKRDGLYWKSDDPKDQSPLGPAAAEAVAEGYRKTSAEPMPFHGYIFKMLYSQGDRAPGGRKNYIDKQGNMTGGFALLAYPARWGTSGIMSFIVNQDGVVYEKDLDIQTVAIAETMTEFNPDSSWQTVVGLGEEEGEDD